MIQHNQNGQLTRIADQDIEDIRHGALVDIDLSKEAQQCRDMAIASQIFDEQRRASAVFLGRDNVDQVEKVVSILIGKVLLECLARFIHSRGAQVAWSTRFERDSVNAIQQTVQIDGETRQFLRDGQLFIYSERERVVVTATAHPSRPRKLLQVQSDVSSAAFFQEWEEYARSNNYLRGRSFFADGWLIESKESYTWDAVVLPEKTKRIIQTHVCGFLKSTARLRGLGVKTRRGLILAGPPGTGKTLLGKVLANTLDASFIWVTPRHVKGPQSFEDIDLPLFFGPVSMRVR
jgi:hypothetical protein